jgi:hypothetical protein
VLRFILRSLYSLVLMVALAVAADSAMAQKTDIITLVNGDRITCELKELQRGLLRVKTDSVGTIYVEWLDIATIQSEKHFTVQTTSGVLAFGSLATSEDKQGLDISYADRTVRLKKQAVVEITRVKETFWERLEGSISLGFSYKKANTDVQLNFAADSSYHTKRHSYSAGISALVSSQNDNTATERYLVDFSHQAYIRPNWASLARADLEQNTELDLQLRTLIQGGALYRYFNTNRNRLDNAAGLALNNERYFSTGKDSRTSLEVFFSGGYEFFKFSTPKADVTVRMTVFPSLTESGRVRTSFDTKVRWEIISDLNWDITIFVSTDNQPPEAETDAGSAVASGTDYGIITAFAWTY